MDVVRCRFCNNMLCQCEIEANYCKNCGQFFCVSNNPDYKDFGQRYSTENIGDCKNYLRMIKNAGYRYVHSGGWYIPMKNQKYIVYIEIKNKDLNSKILCAEFDSYEGTLMSIHLVSECDTLETYFPDLYDDDHYESGYGD